MYSQVHVLAQTAESGSRKRLAQALRVAKDHAGDFKSLVPWPALAESFEADVRMLEAALAARFDAADVSRVQNSMGIVSAPQMLA